MIPTNPVKPTAAGTKRPPTAGNTSGGDPDRQYLETATELLMEWFGVAAPQAEGLIATWARDCHRTPEAIARVLVHQIWQGDETYADMVAVRTLERSLRNLPAVLAADLESQALTEGIGQNG
jgi:hypothetical protein